MVPEGFCVFLFLVVTGVLSLCISMMTLRGFLKRFYIYQRAVSIPSSLVYAGFPVGITFLMLAVAVAIPDGQIGRVIIFAGVFPVFLSVPVLMAWQPRWLEPQWFRWLKDNYPHRLPTLLNEATRGGRAWDVQAKTQEGLEEWARRTAAKYRE
jgi:hypothetical protein